MGVTVASLQALLSGRCGALLTAAGLDGSRASAAWLDPIASSARELGVALADPTTAADADLAGVAQAQVSQLADVAEFRALESALGNLTRVTQSISMGSVAYSDLRRDLEKTVARKALYCETRYGVGRGTPSFGRHSLDFQQEVRPCFGPADAWGDW